MTEIIRVWAAEDSRPFAREPDLPIAETKVICPPYRVVCKKTYKEAFASIRIKEPIKGINADELASAIFGVDKKYFSGIRLLTAERDDIIPRYILHLQPRIFSGSEIYDWIRDDSNAKRYHLLIDPSGELGCWGYIDINFNTVSQQSIEGAIPPLERAVLSSVAEKKGEMDSIARQVNNDLNEIGIRGFYFSFRIELEHYFERDFDHANHIFYAAIEMETKLKHEIRSRITGLSGQVHSLEELMNAPKILLPEVILEEGIPLARAGNFSNDIVYYSMGKLSDEEFRDRLYDVGRRRLNQQNI